MKIKELNEAGFFKGLAKGLAQSVAPTTVDNTEKAMADAQGSVPDQPNVNPSRNQEDNLVDYKGKKWALTKQGWMIMDPEAEKGQGVSSAQELNDLNKLAKEKQINSRAQQQQQQQAGAKQSTGAIGSKLAGYEVLSTEPVVVARGNTQFSLDNNGAWYVVDPRSKKPITVRDQNILAILDKISGATSAAPTARPNTTPVQNKPAPKPVDLPDVSKMNKQQRDALRQQLQATAQQQA
jgi:hypothetical protein